MKPLLYHQMCNLIEIAAKTTSSVWLREGNVALTEDLIEGYVVNFAKDRERVAITTTGELMREIQFTHPEGRHRVLVVRGADRMFTPDTKDVLLTVLERERRNARLRVVFVGEEPEDETMEWFLRNKAYGIVSEPTFEKRGAWMATKTAGRWDYYKRKGELVTEQDGFRLMEHVGWDYTAALQAAATIRAYTTERLSWDVLSALVPAKAGFGYAESIVFGKGRKSSLKLAEGIPDHQMLKTLGLMRYYLRQFAKLRAVGVERMSDRAVTLETGVHVWQWRTKYKPSYARYTNDRIRMRQNYIEEAMRAVRSGATTGVLEVLALKW